MGCCKTSSVQPAAELKRHWAVILALLALVASFTVPSYLATQQQAAAVPMSYPDLPNPIEDPNQPGVALPKDALPVFHPGDQIITLPYRCVTDDGGTGLGELTYTFTRALYYAERQTPTRALDMPGGQNAAPVGCARIRSTIHYVPAEALPGVYYIGGTVSAIGAKRAATIAWRTVDFRVEAGAGGPLPQPTPRQ